MENIFEGISNKNKNKLLKNLGADTLHYTKDESVIRLFKDDNIINFIVKGNVKVVLNSINGNQIVTEDLYDGDVFSSTINYIDENETDAIVTEDTEIISMNQQDIIDFKDNSKSYYNMFIKNLFIIMTKKISERNAAKKNKDFALADQIRNELLEQGIVLLDTREGTKYEVK